MNIFNNKRIAELEADNARIFNRLEIFEKELERQKKEVKCFEFGDAVPERSYLFTLMKFMYSLEDYLGVRLEYTLEDDPVFKPPEYPKIKVWKLYEIKRKIKSKS